MRNYDKEIEAASNYLDLPKEAAKRVSLQCIDKGFIGGNLVRYHYNLHAKTGQYLETIEVFPDFEDKTLASQKVLSALKARKEMDTEQIKQELTRQKEEAIKHNSRLSP